MKRLAARMLYIALLDMHPRSFRLSFGDEMLQVFEEASAVYGWSWLIGELMLSLLRQRLLRWPDAVALAVADERLCLLTGTYPMLRPPHLTARKLSLAFLFSLLTFTSLLPGNTSNYTHRANPQSAMYIHAAVNDR